MKRKVLRSYTVSTISIALVVFIMGAIGYMMASVFASAHAVREGVEMIVELRDDVDVEHRDSIGSMLLHNEMVASVRFVSRDEKLADEAFRKVFDVDIKGILGKNPLPDSFDVRLSAQASDKGALEAFVEWCKTIDGIKYVSYPEELLDRVHTVLDTMQLLLLVFGGAMLIISIVLLYNTIRLAIYSRREAINTMKMVGATRWFIIKPFLAKSGWQGLIAGVLASALFVAALYGLDHTLPELGLAEQLELLGVVVGAMVVVSVAVAMLFTLFTVNRFINMQSNKIHLY